MNPPCNFSVEHIITEQDIKNILLLEEHDDSLEIGPYASLDPNFLVRFFNVWCPRIDKAMEIDRMAHGEHTVYSHELLKCRGFTFKEYLDLFNPHIGPEDFGRYPIFLHLNRDKDLSRGGIVSDIQRQRMISFHNLEPNEESYTTAIRDGGMIEVIDFFLRGRLPYRMSLKKMLMHTYIVAPTGAGKSELLRYMFYQLQRKYPTFSLILIDPHGDLALKLKRLYLNKDPKRLIYIDPYFKDGYTPTFNVFDIGTRSGKDINFASEQIIVAFEEVLTRQGGELSESMVNMVEKCLNFLLKREGSTMLDLLDLLALGPIQKEAAESNPYFEDAFMNDPMDKKTRKALHTRVERILNQDVNRSLLGGQSTFNLDHAINSGKVMLFNLAELGELSQAMFGKFLIANIKSLIRKRSTVNPRRTFLFIDECQNFVSGSYEYMLSQLRKYGLHLVLANQYAAQLEGQLEAVRQNTALKIVGGDDPENISSVFKIPDEDRLKEYEFFSKARGKKMVKFSSPSVLIKNKKKRLTPKQEATLDSYLLEHYYKVIGEPIGRYKRQEETDTQEKQTRPQKRSKKKTTPPYDLYLGDDADTPTE